MFETVEAASAAQRAMHMRWFARKMISAIYMVSIGLEDPAEFFVLVFAFANLTRVNYVKSLSKNMGRICGRKSELGIV
jgi:hypothetical protein